MVSNKTFPLHSCDQGQSLLSSICLTKMGCLTHDILPSPPLSLPSSGNWTCFVLETDCIFLLQCWGQNAHSFWLWLIEPLILLVMVDSLETCTGYTEDLAEHCFGASLRPNLASAMTPELLTVIGQYVQLRQTFVASGGDTILVASTILGTCYAYLSVPEVIRSRFHIQLAPRKLELKWQWQLLHFSWTWFRSWVSRKKNFPVPPKKTWHIYLVRRGVASSRSPGTDLISWGLLFLALTSHLILMWSINSTSRFQA